MWCISNLKYGKATKDTSSNQLLDIQVKMVSIKAQSLLDSFASYIHKLTPQVIHFYLYFDSKAKRLVSSGWWARQFKCDNGCLWPTVALCTIFWTSGKVASSMRPEADLWAHGNFWEWTLRQVLNGSLDVTCVLCILLLKWKGLITYM